MNTYTNRVFSINIFPNPAKTNTISINGLGTMSILDFWGNLRDCGIITNEFYVKNRKTIPSEDVAENYIKQAGEDVFRIDF
jgi:hypothetical protein